MAKLDINCDMGEAYSIYRCGDDAGIMPFITSANVACGFHASDPTVMHETVLLAKRHSVKVGAHPSFPDRDGFGRRYMSMDRVELRDAIIYQVGALKAFLDIEGIPLNHIKPHGALYSAAWTDQDAAIACAEAAAAFGVPMYGTTGTLHETIWPRYTPVRWEIFADLDYDDEGRCIITREHSPVAPERAVAQILRVVREGCIRSINGKDVPTRVDTICVHSDTPGAVEVAKAVYAAVEPWLALPVTRAVGFAGQS